MEDLAPLQADFIKAIEKAETEAELEALRLEALGKKGRISLMMRELGTLPPEDRKTRGATLNLVKQALTQSILQRKQAFQAALLEKRLKEEYQDASLPALPEHKGRVHPVSQVLEEAMAIFAAMGFHLAEGPDIEDDFHNFTALNFPPDHPARHEQDTFFLKTSEGEDIRLLRTHTSPVQIRTLQTQKPPLRIIAPGRVYRRDWDRTHTPMFHQLEGLVVEENIHMGHLKGCLQDFISAFFECEVKTRFRPHYFPFTEPSAEMDIGYQQKGDSLHIGQGGSWMEILGCGMVHPHVLEACGLDPSRYQGFAFGMGIDRLAMLKYGAPDLRAFFAGDPLWLAHYGFKPFSMPNLATGLS